MELNRMALGKAAGLVFVRFAAVLVLLPVIGITVSLEGEAGEKQEVTLELLWQRQFEEEVIGGVCSEKGPIVITENNIYRVNVAKSEVELLCPTYQGSKEPRWRRSWVYPAANGKFICLRHEISVDETCAVSGTPYSRFVQIEVINDGGERLWDLPFRDVDSYGEYIHYAGGWISNDGFVVVTDEDSLLRGKLIFYDPKGERVNEFVYSRGELNMGSSRKGAFSANGQYFAFSGCQGIGEANNSPSYLLMTDKSGKLLWKDTKKTRRDGYGGGGTYQKLAISSGGSYVAVTTWGHGVRILAFNKAGNLLWSREPAGRFGPTTLDFAYDEKTLLVSDEGNLEGFASQTGKRLWNNPLKEQGLGAPLSAHTEGGSQFYVLASGSELLLVNENGKLSEGTELVGASTESKTRARIYPKLSSKQNLILVVFPNQVYLYRIRKD